MAGMGLMQPVRTARVSELVASGRLVPVLQDWSAGTQPMMVLCPRNRHLTAKVRVFAEWVNELFKAEFEAVVPPGP